MKKVNLAAVDCGGGLSVTNMPEEAIIVARDSGLEKRVAFRKQNGYYVVIQYHTFFITVKISSYVPIS